VKVSASSAGVNGRAPNRSRREDIAVIVLLALAVAAEIVFFTAIYIPAEIGEMTLSVRERLLSVSDDRRKTLEIWVRGRGAVAEVVATDRAVVNLVATHPNLPAAAGEDLRGSTPASCSMCSRGCTQSSRERASVLLWSNES
jgi:hypothetical protein